MIQFIKRFLEWFPVKKRLDDQSNEPPQFKEGEVWWCFVGENIGTEISGKSLLFTRPILIIKIYNRYSFFGLPLTTKSKVGTWYVPIEFNKMRQYVNPKNRPPAKLS